MRSARVHQATQIVGSSTRRLGRRAQQSGAPAADPATAPPVRKKLSDTQVRHPVAIGRMKDGSFRARCEGCGWEAPLSRQIAEVVKAAEQHGAVRVLSVPSNVRAHAVKMIRNLRSPRRRRKKSRQ